MAVTLASGLAAPARAATRLPVNYDFIAGSSATALAPDIPACPGANNPSCQRDRGSPQPGDPRSRHLREYGRQLASGGAALLANHGYCVYAFNYGGASPASPVQGTGEIAASAAQLATFVNTAVLSRDRRVQRSTSSATPRSGAVLARLRLRGGRRVNDLVALAPSNFGTTLDGFTELASLLGESSAINGALSSVCEACVQQEQGSAFLARLNATPTVPGVHYTVIESVDDEVVTPYTNAFLPAAPNVTNITVQHQCVLDGSDHLGSPPTLSRWRTMLSAWTRPTRYASLAWSCRRSLAQPWPSAELLGRPGALIPPGGRGLPCAGPRPPRGWARPAARPTSAHAGRGGGIACPVR